MVNNRDGTKDFLVSLLKREKDLLKRKQFQASSSSSKEEYKLNEGNYPNSAQADQEEAEIQKRLFE